MKVLALDLTGTMGTFALLDGGAVRAEESLTSPDGFAHIVFDRLREFLGRSGVRLDEIDCYASASGPGAFTGVRVGLAAVKGLAEAMGRPAVGVSNLKALASGGEGEVRAPVLDARRGDVFSGVYDGNLQELAPESVETGEGLVARLRSIAHGKPVVITTDVEWLRRSVAMGSEWTVVERPAGLAVAVARCAALEMERGASGDPAALDANYVRRSDAEMAWTDKREGLKVEG